MLRREMFHDNWINNLAEEAFNVSAERGRKEAHISTDSESLLKHAAGEIVEASFTYAQPEEQKKEVLLEEVSDAIMCLLILAHKEGLDIQEGLLACLNKNKRRAGLSQEGEE